MNLQELSSYLSQILQISEFKDFCPNGLQVQGRNTIHKVLFAVTASQKAIEYAAKHNFDALIVHHGLFWNNASPIVTHSMHKRLKPLLEHDISLFAYHLPLDAHELYGNNFGAARLLGLKELTRFVHFGVMGTISPTPIQTFIKSLENFYKHPSNCALGGKKQIETIAIVSGGGWRFIQDAIAANIDLLVSGNFDEPAWHLSHENHIHFAALGHDATEQLGLQLLKAHLVEQFSMQAEFLDLLNPF